MALKGPFQPKAFGDSFTIPGQSSQFWKQASYYFM